VDISGLNAGVNRLGHTPAEGGVSPFFAGKWDVRRPGLAEKPSA
jgi:hypothetical protein